jgi:hypothetical protein
MIDRCLALRAGNGEFSSLCRDFSQDDILLPEETRMAASLSPSFPFNRSCPFSPIYKPDNPPFLVGRPFVRPPTWIAEKIFVAYLRPG